MYQSAGTLTVNGQTTPLEYADCTLLAGDFDLGFSFYSMLEGGGDLGSLPVGDIVDYALLDGLALNYECDDPILGRSGLRPSFSINAQFYELRSLMLEPLRYSPEDKSLSVNACFAGYCHDEKISIDARLEVKAECVEIDKSSVLRSAGPIPIQFVKHYFPIIGLPVLPDNAMREDVVRLIGAPYRQGDGVHPKYGSLTDWTIYQLPEHYMRFQFDCDRVTEVTFMPKEGPFALKI